jgi:hypothetical protein
MGTMKFGPGTLKIGATGTEIDVSCNIVGARIKSNVDQEDSVTYLCGTVEPGGMTFDHEFTGTINVDVDGGANSLFALSWDQKGTEQAFVFTPNTAGEATATGTLIITPLDFGADAFGDRLNSEFTWPIKGDPVYDYDGAALTAAEVDAEPAVP